MTIESIREKLVNYLEVANEEKLKAIYIMVEDEISTIENDWENDFERDLNDRSGSFNNGSAKTYSWEETKTAAIQRVKSKK